MKRVLNFMGKHLLKLGIRKCVLCKNILPLDCFYNIDRYRCKPCECSYVKEHRKYDPVKAKLKYLVFKEKIKNDPILLEKYKQTIKNRKRIYKKKLRFDILKKFNFTCQYCGRKSPEVILEVDHIIPKSKGGKNTLDNLTLACRECNIGKLDVLLT